MKAPLWKGVYASLKDVPIRGKGFDGETWRKHSLAKMVGLRRLAREKRSIPSVTRFHECLLPAAAAMIHAEQGRVRILDFGGGMGFSYYPVKGGLPPPARLEFHVVELETVCRAGRRFFRGDRGIRFHPSLDECGKKVFDIVHIGSSLQYIEDWRALLRTLCRLKARYVMLTNLPAGDIPTFATAQKYYESRIASWFFRAEDIIKVFSGQEYRLVFKSTYALKIFGVEQPYPQDNFPKKYRLGSPGSMLFRRKE